jgi:hypothetical protein
MNVEGAGYPLDHSVELHEEQVDVKDRKKMKQAGVKVERRRNSADYNSRVFLP